jgi:hypothetical protein
MNNVIHIRPANNPRRMASGDRGAAQILFFTGVRYQRWGEDTHAQPRAEFPGKARARSDWRNRKGAEEPTLMSATRKWGAFFNKGASLKSSSAGS